MNVLYWCDQCKRDFVSEDRVCPVCHTGKYVVPFDDYYVCEECGDAFEEPSIEFDECGIWEEPMEVCPYCRSSKIRKIYGDPYEPSHPAMTYLEKYGKVKKEHGRSANYCKEV